MLKNNWNKPKVQGDKPQTKAFHTATIISNDRMLILGGFSGEPYDG
jgi:hypothetical protein